MLAIIIQESGAEV